MFPLASAGELVEHKAVSALAEDGGAACALVVLGAVAGVLDVSCNNFQLFLHIHVYNIG